MPHIVLRLAVSFVPEIIFVSGRFCHCGGLTLHKLFDILNRNYMNGKKIKMYKIAACSSILLALIVIFSIFHNRKNEAAPEETELENHSVTAKVEEVETVSEDSLFLKRIIDGDFFELEHSEEQDYALVVEHCLHHTDEQYDEAFSDGLALMLRKYPDKIKGITKALGKLSKENQKAAWHNMFGYIASSWIMNNQSDTITPDMFYRAYPFLTRSSETDSLLTVQMKNYE